MNLPLLYRIRMKDLLSGIREAWMKTCNNFARFWNEIWTLKWPRLLSKVPEILERIHPKFIAGNNSPPAITWKLPKEFDLWHKCVKMERDLGIRRPAPSKSEGLSKTAKTFFGLNIFQGEKLTFSHCILHPHCVTCWYRTAVWLEKS